MSDDSGNEEVWVSHDREAVAYCPRDRNGTLYIEHADESRTEVEDEVRMLNGSPTDTSGRGLGAFVPFTVVPLYAAPVAAQGVTEEVVETCASLCDTCGSSPWTDERTFTRADGVRVGFFVCAACNAALNPETP